MTIRAEIADALPFVADIEPLSALEAGDVRPYSIFFEHVQRCVLLQLSFDNSLAISSEYLVGHTLTVRCPYR